MDKILHAITLSRILVAAIFLTSFWLFKVIIKKEKYNFFRGILFFLFLLLAFLYVNDTQYGHLTLFGLYDQVFPAKPLELNYRTDVIGRPPNAVTTFTFYMPRPSLNITMDKNGQYFHINNPRKVNLILSQLGLPLVQTGVPELASLTGSQAHRSQYRWENYPLGVLTLVKTRCQNRDSVQFYDCVIKISITSGMHRLNLKD